MNDSYDENCSNIYDEQTRDNQEQQNNLGNRSKGDDLMEELLIAKSYDSADSYQFRALFRKMISLQWK
jgi:hypothetical protein